MPRGGYRPNAGRKKTDRPSVPKSENVINRAKRDFERMTPETIEALKNLAHGLSVEDKNGKVYKERPSLAAIELILAYGIGKPADKTELTGKNGTALIPSQPDAKSVEERLSQLLELAKGRQEKKADSSTTEQSEGVLPTTAPAHENIGVAQAKQNLNSLEQQNLNSENHVQQNLNSDSTVDSGTDIRQNLKSSMKGAEDNSFPDVVSLLEIDAGIPSTNL